MKPSFVPWLIFGTALLGASSFRVNGADEKAAPLPTLTVSSLVGYSVPGSYASGLQITGASSVIEFQTDKGVITINCRTGSVELSKGMTLDAAAVEFWKAVAKAFPNAKKMIVEGEIKTPAGH